MKRLLLPALVAVQLMFTPLQVMAQELDSLKRSIKIVPENQRSEMYSKMARLYLSQSIDTAHLYCDSAVLIARENEQLPQEALALKTKGIVYYYAANYAEANQYYAQSGNIYSQLSDSAGMAAINNNIAILSELQGDYHNAVVCHLKALTYFERHGTPKEVARSFNNLGNVYVSIGNFDNGMIYYKKALHLYTLSADSVGIGNSYNNIAATFSELTQFDSALHYHKQSLEIRTRINDRYGIATSLLNVGNTLMNQLQYAEAMPYIDKAILEAKVLEDKKSELNMQVAKSNVLINLNQLESALKVLKEAESQSIAMDVPDLRRDIYQNYAKLYLRQREFEKAYHYLYRHLELKDSLVNIENANYIADLESKYQFEKKNQQIEFQNAQIEIKNREIKKNKLIIGLVLGLFLVAIALLFLIAWAFKNKRNSHLKIESQNKLLLTQKKQITDSIQYAERIQSVLTSDETKLQHLFTESFLIYLPKDIVSGDFVWLRKIGDTTAIAMADCTGHGVPGAFMSILGISFLNEISQRPHLPEPAAILDEMRQFIKNSLNQTGVIGEHKDGIQIGLYFFNESLSEIKYASAYHQAYLVSQGKMTLLQYEKQPVGVYFREYPFQTFQTPVNKGDALYLFSDGYIDQFGQNDLKRYGSKRFSDSILKISNETMMVQKSVLMGNLANWKGKADQVDDITVMGLKI